MHELARRIVAVSAAPATADRRAAVAMRPQGQIAEER